MARDISATQFSIDRGVKDSLDVFKAQHKEQILSKYVKSKRYVTNSMAIAYLLDTRLPVKTMKVKR